MLVGIRQAFMVVGILVCAVKAQSTNTVCCTGQGPTTPPKLDPTTCKANDNGASTFSPMACTVTGTSCKAYTCVVKAVGMTVSTTYYQSCLTDAAVNSTIASMQTGGGGSGQSCNVGTSGAGPRLGLSSCTFLLVFFVCSVALSQHFS